MPRHYFQSLLLFGVLTLLSVFFYARTITSFPAHIHGWTQSDRYALALGFWDNGFDFFHPQVPNLEPRVPPRIPGPQAEQGITGVDFPVHDYLAAVLMKLFGSQAPGIFRIYTLIFSILGTWFLFRLARDASGSVWKGLAAAVFVFSAPIITYYQAGFIPSAPSFAATLIGYFFYFRYRENGVPADFRWALGFLALAALARSPFNIFLFAVLLQQGLQWWQKRRIPRHELLAFGGAYAAIIGWLVYKNYLDKTYGSQFIGYLLPAKSTGELLKALGHVWQKWYLEVFTVWHWLLLAGVVVTSLVAVARRQRFSALQKAILLQSLIALAGALVFQALMIGAYHDHEYYFIDSFYPGLALLFVFGLSVAPFEKQSTKLVVSVLLAGLLIGCVVASARVQRRKHSTWNYDAYEIVRHNFAGSDLLLDSLGIPRDAKILVIDAVTTNLPLLLLHRRGYTVLSTRRDKIAAAMRLPFDYVTIQDVSIPSEVVFPYPEILDELERVGGNGRVSVFRRRNAAGHTDLDEFMGLQTALRRDTLDFEQTGELAEWGLVEHIKPDTAARANHFGFLLPDQAYSPTLTIATDVAGADCLLWEGLFRAASDPATVKITVTADGPDGQAYYRDRTLKLRPEDGWRRYQVLFTELPRPVPGGKLKCYVWNPEHAALDFDDWRVRFYRHNPQ